MLICLKNFKLAKKFSGLQYDSFSETLQKKLDMFSKTANYEFAAQKIKNEDNTLAVQAKLMEKNSEKMA